jgi:hypothetical protein
MVPQQGATTAAERNATPIDVFRIWAGQTHEDDPFLSVFPANALGNHTVVTAYVRSGRYRPRTLVVVGRLAVTARSVYD